MHISVLSASIVIAIVRCLVERKKERVRVLGGGEGGMAGEGCWKDTGNGHSINYLKREDCRLHMDVDARVSPKHGRTSFAMYSSRNCSDLPVAV